MFRLLYQEFPQGFEALLNRDALKVVVNFLKYFQQERSLGERQLPGEQREGNWGLFLLFEILFLERGLWVVNCHAGGLRKHDSNRTISGLCNIIRGAMEKRFYADVYFISVRHATSR